MEEPLEWTSSPFGSSRGTLGNNLYRIWNRMSSGSYFPPPVKAVAIPKKSGGERTLGVPTVSDRIAQTVVKLVLEPQLDPHFHADSYGYRPGKSAHQAIEVTRKRCWWHDWVLEFDIRGLFDNIDHGLLMKAVRRHTDCKWVLLYIERWLTAPMQNEDGTLAGGTEVRRRVASSRRCWPICSCTMHSTGGWRRTFRRCHFAGTPTTD